MPTGLAATVLLGTILLLTASAGPAAADLVGHWGLDEGAGGLAADASGGGHHGTLESSPEWTAGLRGGALHFPGSLDRVVVPAAPGLDVAGAFTVSAWIRPLEKATQYVVKRGRFDESDGFGLSLSSSGRVFVRVNQASAGDAYKLLSQSAYPTDGASWLHAAASFDGATLRIYVNGVLEGELPAPGLLVGGAGEALGIGAQPDGLRAYTGAVDEVRIHDRALSAAELLALVAGDLPPDADGDGVPDPLDAFPLDPGEWADADGDGTGDGADPDDDDDGMPDAWELQHFFDPFDPADAAADADADGSDNLDEFLAGGDPRDGAVPGLAGSWHFDASGGSVATDGSGLGNHGDAVGSPARVPGLRSHALLVDGSGARVEVPHVRGLEPSAALSVAAWVRPTRAATQYLVKKGRYDESDGYELALSSGGSVFARLSQASAGNAYKLSSVSPYPTDGTTWLHVAATFDGESLALYLDGVLEAELPAAGLVLGQNGQPLSIGAQDDGAGAFAGALDEVRVYNRALSPGEIQDLVDGISADDADGDGIPDADDAFPDDPDEWADADGDGVGDHADPDDDGDGLPDAWELAHHLDPLDPTDADQDPDGDGVSSRDEYLAGTDPRDDLAPDQRLFLRFDEAGGAAVADHSGHGHHGAVTGLPSWIAGPAGGALQLEYAPDLVTVPDHAGLDLVEAITVAAWVQPHRKSTQVVVAKASYGWSDGYELGLSSSGRVFARFNQASSGNLYKILSTRSYPTDGIAWVHAAVTFDGGEIRLYLDGELEATLAAPGLRIGSNDLPLAVGGEASGARRLRGGVDEVRVYNHALDPAEVAAVGDEGVAPDADWDGVPDAQDLFPADPFESADADGDGIGDRADEDDDDDGIPDGWEIANGLDPLDPADADGDLDLDGLGNRDEFLTGGDPRELPLAVGHWRLDEGQGDAAADASPWSNHGDVLAHPRWLRGPGGGLLLRRRAQCVRVADDPSLDAAGAISVAAWVRPDRFRRRIQQSVVSKARARQVDGYELGITPRGRFYARFNERSARNLYRVTSRTRDVRDGRTWRHVAATFDGSRIRLYVDGVLERERPAPGLAVAANGLDLAIGSEPDGRYRYRGAVDDVRVFDRALAPEELRALAGTHTRKDLEDWSPRPLEPRRTTRSTGEKPQSKVWRHDDRWWAVFPDERGTFLWRLDASRWSPVLLLSPSAFTKADYALGAADGLVHVLLHGEGGPSELVSAEYVPGFPGRYRLWSLRPEPVAVPVSDLAETSTLAMDGTGRLWVAYDTWGTVQVRHAGPADHYASWSDFVTVAEGIDPDAISAIAAFDGKVGVIWSDANSRRFGFRFHRDGDDPALWSDDEVPAAATAGSPDQWEGFGMADDHLNFAVASNGTLYVAVKTGYDTAGLPVLGLLVRRTSGSWDELHFASDHGTRPVVALDETQGKLLYAFTSTYVGGAIEYKVADTRTLHFGETRTLLPGTNWNDVSTTKQTFSGELLLIATPDQPEKQLQGVRLAP